MGGSCDTHKNPLLTWSMSFLASPSLRCDRRTACREEWCERWSTQTALWGGV